MYYPCKYQGRYTSNHQSRFKTFKILKSKLVMVLMKVLQCNTYINIPFESLFLLLKKKPLVKTIRPLNQ